MPIPRVGLARRCAANQGCGQGKETEILVSRPFYRLLEGPSHALFKLSDWLYHGRSNPGERSLYAADRGGVITSAGRGS